MICTISGDPMYLIEGTPNQTYQADIDSLCEPSDPELFFVNSTIWYLHTNTAPKTPAKNIGFSPHFHIPSTTTVYPDFPVDQCLQHSFQPAVTCRQVIVDKTTDNTPLLAQK